MLGSSRLVVGLVALAFSMVGCKPTAHLFAKDRSSAATAEPAVMHSGDVGDAGTPNVLEKPEAALPPARVEHLLVAGDQAASVVRSKDGKAPLTVFLPGMCSNANAYLQTFPEAARKQGGVVAIEGDQPCGNLEGFHSFSWDAGRQHARVEAALAAAGVTEIPREGITLIGYSQGAALAEQMVQRWPGRYARIVIMGSPTDPAAKNFARARALVTMSCDRDVPARMKQASVATSKTGVPSTYFEMPKCTHGNITDGERIFDATFDWFHENERAPDSKALAVRIVGISPS